MYQITSSNNPIIKELKNLSKKKDRWIKKQYIIEGTKPVREAIQEKTEIINIFYSEKLFDREEGKTLFNELEHEKNIIKLEDKLFQSISNMENSQGIFAVAKFKNLSFEDMKSREVYIYLDEIQDPGNMGTIIRSSDAFHMGGIIIGKGCVDPFNPKVVRASMGSIFRVNLIFEEKANETFEKLKQSGRRILVTSLENSNDINQFSFYNNDIIVIGNEGKGVKKEILEIANSLIKIPMRGLAESLNAGIAASIVMYEISSRA
ncbi:MAG: RNA methyltransferase [Gudongella sp.]|nr:RNA methyltransferase [Gudongella sp.]